LTGAAGIAIIRATGEVAGNLGRERLPLCIIIAGARETTILYQGKGNFIMTDNEMIMEQLQSLRKSMEKGFQSVNHRIDGLDQRMDGLDQRIDGLDQKIDGVEQSLTNRIDDLDRKIDGVEQSLTNRIDDLDRKTNDVEQRMVKRQTEFQNQVMAELQKQTDTLNDKILETDEHLCDVEHQIKVYMENAVGKRVDVLLEGYEFNRDHIAEIKSNEKHLQRQLDELQVRMAVLEKKVSA